MTRLVKAALIILMIGFVLFFFLAPLVPQGGYGFGYNLPEQIYVHTACYTSHRGVCYVGDVEGRVYVSISYSLFGVGEYLFVNSQVGRIWAFVW